MDLTNPFRVGMMDCSLCPEEERAQPDERRGGEGMQTTARMLHILLDIGDAMVSNGAEIFRVEDTLDRMGRASGAVEMNVFVITSSIVITMVLPDGSVVTQTRRIKTDAGSDFVKVDALNQLSRDFCAAPFSEAELERRLREIDGLTCRESVQLLGSILAAASFSVFFGGSNLDGLVAGLVGIFIYGLQKYLRPLCMNRLAFQFAASFLTGLVICVCCRLVPVLHVDEIMIGDIMLLIPGLMMTNAIRDMLIGDTISGTMRFVEALLLAGMLALGFIGAIFLMGRVF